MSRSACWTLSGLSLAAFMLGGCAPTKAPTPLESKIFAPSQWRGQTEAVAPVSAEWWQSFKDPGLNELIEAALAHNTDILTSIAMVEQARQQIGIVHSALLPTLNGSLGAQTTRNLGPTGITHSQSVQPEIQVAYELDLWGRQCGFALSSFGWRLARPEDKRHWN